MRPTLLASLLLTFAASAHAQDFAARVKARSGERANELRGGRATLTLGASPRLRLSLAGERARDLPGLEVQGGYLFTADLRHVQDMLPKAGLVAAIQSVTVVRQGEALTGLRLRSAPDGETIGSVRRGQTVEILETQGNWAKVKADYKEGWVALRGDRDYLRLSEVPQLTHVANQPSIFLRRRGPVGWEGQVKEDDDWTGDIALRVARHAAPAAKRILVVPDARHNGDGGAFLAYARQLEQSYGAKGYQTVIADIDSWEDVIDELQAAASAPYARLMIIGHGGWDGPVLHAHVGTRQVSGKYNVEVFERFVAAVKVGMSADGRIFNSSCHAAGTARLENVSYGSDYRWVHDLALRTGRQVAGPAGKTSTEWTNQHVLAALEGQGTVVQEVHVARGSELRILNPGQTLASVPTRPLPPIAGLPQPKPEETAAVVPAVVPASCPPRSRRRRSRPSPAARWATEGPSTRCACARARAPSTEGGPGRARARTQAGVLSSSSVITSSGTMSSASAW